MFFIWLLSDDIELADTNENTHFNLKSVCKRTGRGVLLSSTDPAACQQGS